MFFEKIQMFVRGCVSFEASGGFPERFINLCRMSGIYIQNVKMFHEKITAVCDIKSYKRIRGIAKKSGMRVRIKNKRGLPFFIRAKRKRVGILFGFVFMIVMTSFLTGRIWVIDVAGNESLTVESIVQAYSSLGVKTGIRRGSIDAKDVAAAALGKIDKLMWNAVNINGCRITIEVKEQKEKRIEEKNENAYANIVASNSGQILKIENFLGTPVLEAGSAVEKGDIIVSGAVINKDESVSFYEAEANVYAKTKNTVSSFQSAVREMRVYKRARKKYFLTFFSLTFPVNYMFLPRENYSFSYGEDFLQAELSKMPVGVRTERYAPYEKKKVKLTAKAMKLMCLNEYFKEIDERFDLIQIEKTDSQMEIDKNYAKIESVFECRENIAEQKSMDLTLQNDIMNKKDENF